MLRSSTCDCSDTCVLVKEAKKCETSAASNNAYKKVTFKNCAPFTNCISRINNAQIDDAIDIDIVIPLYDFIEYSDSCSKTPGILWKHCRGEPALANNNIFDLIEGNTTSSFNIKEEITGQTDKNGTKNVKIMLPLKYLSDFWGIPEMPLINCKINLDLKWSKNCAIVGTNIAA